MRWLKIIGGFILGLILGALILAALVWFQRVEPSQQDLVDQPLYYPDTLAGKSYNIDSLRALVGPDKKTPSEFELAALLAYSAYPELKGARIEMLLTDYGPPMQANMDVWTLFGAASNRLYQITLNDQRNTGYDAILLRQLPLDAQVGILAHELGHVAYYHRLNTLQIAKWGLMYLWDDEFRATHERTTDLMPVYHGLGSQIYQYAYHVRNDPSCIPIYERGKEFMDKYYMTDLEIKTVWDSNP